MTFFVIIFYRCSQIQDCHQVEVHPLKFVSDEAKCVKFASISPEKIPHDGNVVVSLVTSCYP